MQIIPAIDIIEGKCVRLTEGDYAQKKIYNEDPLEVAKQFEGVGLMRLHLVDLDGAKAGKVINWKVLEKIANKTSLIIDFGGGIKTEATLKTVLDTGATYATIGSLAVKERITFEEWIERFGAAVFMLGADVHAEKIAIGGWIEKTTIDVCDFIGSYMDKGVTQLFCTDIQKDGKLEGPSIALYQKILKQYPSLQLIASGGVSQLKDLEELRTIGCSAAILGKAIYENKISLSELSTFSN
jgi:phosphoribosylformimino-5-aminoimidazole carboxamide ribotide isomerase